MIPCNLRGNITGVGLASDQSLPSLTTLTDDVGGIPESELAFEVSGVASRLRLTSCSCTRQ
jgi:hypothetical protein